MTDPTMQAREALMRRFAGGWWLVALRAVAAILFGLVALFQPQTGLAVTLAFIAAWAAVDGAAALWQAKDMDGGIWPWVEGICGLATAAIVITAPGVTAMVLVIFAAVWFLASGVMRLVLAFRLGGVLLGVLGAINILIGGWMLANPAQGLLALVWLIGLEALAMGFLLGAVAIGLRKVAQGTV